MKRKVIGMLLCLAISVSVVACGNKDNSTEPVKIDNAVEANESVGTETVATETQEVQVKEIETPEEETEDFENYKELESVPVEGRDGSQENPYRVGDTIYFPKVMIDYNKESLETMYTSLTVVVEDATAEYVKISYKFGIDSWEELDWKNWSMSACMVDFDRVFMPFREDRDFNQLGSPLTAWNSLNDVYKDVFIEEADRTEVTLYFQDSDGIGCTEETAYLMLVYSKISLPEDEHYQYFNCTFVEIQ